MSKGGLMFEARRPPGRFFCLLLSVLVACGVSHGQTPATTTISDVVYRADGTPAGGTLLIFWPAFITADGKAVAAGTKSVTLGTQGALSVALVPNAGATPAGTFYTVVFQLDDSSNPPKYSRYSAALHIDYPL
jgi:trimeric autotransporter adhesin